MSRPMWFVGLIRRSFPYRFAAARITRWAPAGRIAERMLFEGDDIMLLPRTVSVGEEVAAGPATVVPFEVVEHFIERAGFLWIMNECICRRSAGCKDYPVDLGCLFLGEAARDINPRLGRSATRQEAMRHLEKCRDAGLFHLVGRNKLDTVWLNVGPGNRLLTVCNCCTCCCLWRMLPDLSAGIAKKLTRMPGLEVRVTESCTGCGTCLEAGCMVGAIGLEGGKASIGDECRGCGRCAETCPEDAIELRFEKGPGPVAMSIERIEGRVDVT